MNLRELVREALSQAFAYEMPSYAWHQTALSNANEILASGFKSGVEIGKGEGTGSIFLYPKHSGPDGTEYSRGQGPSVMLKVDLKGLNLVDTKDLSIDPSKRSFEQEPYLWKLRAEDGDFPSSVDGVVIRANNGKILEIAITPEAANRGLERRIYTRRGKVV